MPLSFRSKLSKLEHKGQISQEEYQSLITKLDGHDKEIYNQALEDFKTELIKIYHKRYMHDIYLDDIDDIVGRLSR